MWWTGESHQHLIQTELHQSEASSHDYTTLGQSALIYNKPDLKQTEPLRVATLSEATGDAAGKQWPLQVEDQRDVSLCVWTSRECRYWFLIVTPLYLRVLSSSNHASPVVLTWSVCSKGGRVPLCVGLISKSPLGLTGKCIITRLKSAPFLSLWNVLEIRGGHRAETHQRHFPNSHLKTSDISKTLRPLTSS